MKKNSQTRISRRQLIKRAAGAAGLGLVPPSILAAQKALTPTDAEGPFYPVEIPLDNDNDLIHIAGQDTVADGIPTNVMGRVLDAKGRPITNAVVEIWQCDANGRYHHPDDDSDAVPDEKFQSFGRFETGDDGAYRFLTIRPVAYGSRTPHIHFKIKGPDFEALTTQMYIAGEPLNADDFLYKRLGDKAPLVTVDIGSNPDDSAEQLARFDIVLAADGRFETG